MSYEHGTPFINLPQTTGDDKRDWFDTNDAFLELDSKLKAAYEGSIDTADALAALTEIVSGISTNVETLEGTVGEHTTSISTINEALTLINSALTSLNTSVQGKFDSAGVADPYDAEHGTYDVGDVVTYNGQRYECVTAVTAAEPFDADKWNAVDVQTKLDEINTALLKLEDVSSLFNMNTTLLSVSTSHECFKLGNLIFATFRGTSATDAITTSTSIIASFDSSLKLRQSNNIANINADGGALHIEGTSINNTNHTISVENRGDAGRYLNYSTIFEIID